MHMGGASGGVNEAGVRLETALMDHSMEVISVKRK
jgi:hypothetical protein